MRIVILVLSDLHVGSIFSVWHPEYEDKQGVSYPLNQMQKMLWQYWLNMCEELKDEKPDYTILAGDIIDGVQPANYGRTTMTTDLDDQAACAVKLLQMVPLKRKEYFVVVGTDYHEAKYNDVHYQICMNLNNDDRYFWLDTMGYIQEEDYVINVAHGSSASFIYPETVQAREWQFMLSAAELHKIDRACDLIIRGHLHIYSLIERSGFRLKKFPKLTAPAVTSIKTMINPAFQGQTDYMRRKSPFKLIPDIGYTKVIIDDFGVHVKERIFEHLGIKSISRVPALRKRNGRKK